MNIGDYSIAETVLKPGLLYSLISANQEAFGSILTGENFYILKFTTTPYYDFEDGILNISLPLLYRLFKTIIR